jgi:1-acyl-sn-glycerol-3-phosphate acyltransferase
MSKSASRWSRCEAVVLLWAVAEATWWPIMPDAALAPSAAARPDAWWRLAVAATAGSCLGGMGSYAIGRRWPARPVLARLPLVRPAMVEAADRWLAAEGALALRQQPLSGLPFKVFASLAGDRRVPLGAFVLSAGLFRGARFLAVSAAAGLFGHRFHRQIRSRGPTLLVLWGVLFSLSLWRMVAAWDRRPVEPR